MKTFRLSKNSLNIQKCLLPHCEYSQENYGCYCFINVEGTDCKFLVKIGLCDIRCLDNVTFLDDSVRTFSSFDSINTINYPIHVEITDFKILKKPILGKSVTVIAVFEDVFDVKKYRNSDRLNHIVRDILQLYVISNKCVVFLNNLQKYQTFGLMCIIVTSVDPCGSKIYEVDFNTIVRVEKCISQLQFNQLKKNKNQPQVGGCSRIYSILKETIELSKGFINKKFKVSKNILLIGPQGCGKTTLVHSVTKNSSCVLLELSASYINSLTPNDINKHLGGAFDKAKIYAENGECCVILIEDIDMMSMGKSSHSKKFVAQLITLLEDIENIRKIIVIATTNCPDQVDPQLRRPKRLEDELEIMVPNQEEREDIIGKIVDYCGIECSPILRHHIARWTPGFVGADLRMLVLESLMLIHRNGSQDSLKSADENLLKESFKQALTKVIPSALRGAVGLQTTKVTTFLQIGGLDSIKKILDLSVRQQLLNPQRFQKLGVPLTKGILLYGPPGCAKTTLVKALAKECNTTFLATSAADLYSPFVGDAEKKIVQLFTQARIGSPSIVFIDEIDAVVGSKSGDRERGVQERILSTLLVEMDGVGLKVNTQQDNSLTIFGNDKASSKVINNAVVVIGATNRPQLLDDALKRPGRFDRLLYVPPPDESERLRILQNLTKKMPLDKSVNLENLAKVTEYYSGADLKSLCVESGLQALRSSNMSAQIIQQSHFEDVLRDFKPSLNEKVVGFYESFQKHNV